MTTDKTLPVVAWLYPDGKKVLENEGCGQVYLLEQVFRILPHEAGQPLADHAEASARIAELEAQVAELRAAFGKHVRELFHVRDSSQVQALRQALWDAYVQHPEGTIGHMAGKLQYENAIAAIDAAMEEKGK